MTQEALIGLYGYRRGIYSSEHDFPYTNTLRRRLCLNGIQTVCVKREVGDLSHTRDNVACLTGSAKLPNYIRTSSKSHETCGKP